MSKNVMVIGTGTIGDPLIGLLAEHKDALGLDDVIFFKRTPLSDEKGKVEALLRKGSKIVSSSDTLSDFKQLGFSEIENVENAYEDADAIIDCTPNVTITGTVYILLLINQKDLWHKDLSMDLVHFLLGE